MIKKFWRRFIYIIVIYSDAKGEFKHLIANLMAILLCIPFLYFIFVVIFNSKDYLYILMLAVILGRLFLAYIMERYKRDFGKGYTFFLRSISYTTLTLLFIGGSLKVIDDAKSNTNIQELIIFKTIN